MDAARVARAKEVTSPPRAPLHHLYTSIKAIYEAVGDKTNSLRPTSLGDNTNVDESIT
jgi:hypothetical protein